MLTETHKPSNKKRNITFQYNIRDFGLPWIIQILPCHPEHSAQFSRPRKPWLADGYNYDIYLPQATREWFCAVSVLKLCWNIGHNIANYLLHCVMAVACLSAQYNLMIHRNVVCWRSRGCYIGGWMLQVETICYNVQNVWHNRCKER